jgi:hypothetical protein
MEYRKNQDLFPFGLGFIGKAKKKKTTIHSNLFYTCMHKERDKDHMLHNNDRPSIYLYFNNDLIMVLWIYEFFLLSRIKHLISQIHVFLQPYGHINSYLIYVFSYFHVCEIMRIK